MVVILKMVELNRGREMNVLLRKATDVHGHFGPFLTLGVRMGLLGLRELGARKGDTDLRVTVSLEYTLPFSCMLDGIQASTRCTVGNKRLRWTESKEFGAVFLQQNSGREVEIKINPTVVQELRFKLENTKPMDEGVRQIALETWASSEKKLFSVSHK
jgi:formylmethanofuran dehydrogenase subunit E